MSSLVGKQIKVLFEMEEEEVELENGNTENKVYNHWCGGQIIQISNGTETIALGNAR